MYYRLSKMQCISKESYGQLEKDPTVRSQDLVNLYCVRYCMSTYMILYVHDTCPKLGLPEVQVNAELLNIFSSHDEIKVAWKPTVGVEERGWHCNQQQVLPCRRCCNRWMGVPSWWLHPSGLIASGIGRATLCLDCFLACEESLSSSLEHNK